MKHKILNILLIIFVITAFSGCSFKKGKDNINNGHKKITLTQNQENSAKIQTKKINVMDIDLQITIPAQFKAQNQSLDRIYSPIAGKVQSISVEPGTIVRAGQSLAVMKADEISQIELEFLDRVMDIDADIKQFQAQVEVSRQNYNREAVLVHEKISSKSEYEMARSSMIKDIASLDSLKAKRNTLIKVYQQRLAVYGAGTGVINRVLATKKIYPYVNLVANKNGIVLERKINPGEFVEANTELFNIANLSTIWLVGYAFEKDAPLLRVGEKVQCNLEEEHNKKISGVLSYVSPMLDTQAKTLEVRADVKNDDFHIKPNMYAEMQVKTGTIKELAVPNSAIQKYGDYYFAYVKIKPFVYEERKIEVGQKNEKYSAVLSGLNEGEEVVTQGAFSLLGESIKMQEESE